MKVSPGDIIDRLSILDLKVEHNKSGVFDNEEKAYREEFKKQAVGKKQSISFTCYNILKEINSCIWNLEDAVRKGALDNNPLEVGKRAIKIRKYNAIRVQIKNFYNSEMAEGFEEVKINHLSEA